MRILRIIFAVLPLTVILYSCASKTPVGTDGSSSSSSFSISSNDSDLPLETRNVTYKGIVEASAEVSSVGSSHNLALIDGRKIPLVAEDIDLNGYVGEQVEATGTLRSSVDDLTSLLDVESMSLVTPASSSSASVTPPVSSSPSVPSSVPSATPPPDTPVVSPPPPIDRETPPAPSAEFQSRVDAMASHDLSAAQWSQQYCSEHIGFCMPVHRNWWFKSFGTTSSFLWHIEMNSADIENLGDGPISVNLVSGSLGSKKATNNEVRTQNGQVIGFREWTDNRHFEITAPAALRTAVEYITQNLKPYEVSGESSVNQ